MVIGDPAEWPVEVKLLRLLGDNGKLNDNMFMHVFSSYPAHRSALTNVAKLRSFGCFTRRVLIYGFDYEDWSMEPAVQACETLALAQVSFLDRVVVPFDPLAHPVHKSGKVYTREIRRVAPASWVENPNRPRRQPGLPASPPGRFRRAICMPS